MNIEVPDINDLLKAIMDVKSEYNKVSKPITSWINESRNDLLNNKKLLTGGDTNDIKTLIILYRDLLMRAMSGERSEHLTAAMNKHIRSKSDLNETVFKKIVADCHYRWRSEGVQVMSNVSFYFNSINWNWTYYFALAEKEAPNDFTEDELLKIPHIGFKVRDLAISNFNKDYVAFDIHIVRILTRTGLMNYGYGLSPDENIEMGNNPQNKKQYLFMHKLFWTLSEMTQGVYSMADIDRIFWHFGRTICKAKPECEFCPISKICLTGKSTIF